MCQVIVLFEFHITNLNKRTKHLNGWILRTFSSRDKLTMLTLFKALVMSQLDYGSQLWSPYLTKHINILEKNQQSFTRHISGMQGLSYPERLTVLKVFLFMYGKFWSAKFQTFLLLYVLEHLIVEEEPVLHLTLVLTDWEH